MREKEIEGLIEVMTMILGRQRDADVAPIAAMLHEIVDFSVIQTESRGPLN